MDIGLYTLTSPLHDRTGGTESIFEELFPSLKGNILLLTSGRSNSLAASLEILSYLGQHDRNIGDQTPVFEAFAEKL